MTRFQPILLGSDINVYGMARAFHEEYGIVSEAYAYFQLSPTKFSRIVNVHIVDDFNNFVTFRNFMLKLGKRMKAEDPERVLLLIPCGDVYANLLSQCGDDLYTSSVTDACTSLIMFLVTPHVVPLEGHIILGS